MRNTGFCFLGDQVEYGGARCFTAGTGGGWNGNQWEEGLGNGKPAAQGGVYEVQEVGLGKAGIKIHELRSVNDRTTANGEECCRLVRLGEFNCLLDASLYSAFM